MSSHGSEAPSFLAAKNAPSSGWTGPFIRAPAGGHLGHFRDLSVLNEAAVNMHVLVSVWTFPRPWADAEEHGGRGVRRECPERRTPPGTLRPRRRRAAAPGVRRLTGVGCCLFISVGVSLTTRTVGCVSMSGFAVLVSSPGRRLFRSSARFFIRSFALSLLSFKSSLYILEKSPVSDVSLANILS